MSSIDCDSLSAINFNLSLIVSLFKGKKSNPNEILGKREDLTPNKIKIIAKKFKEQGATIIGGCCETRPSHIEAMANIK